MGKGWAWAIPRRGLEASRSTTDNETVAFTASSGGTYTIRVFLLQDLGPKAGSDYSLELSVLTAPCAEGFPYYASSTVTAAVPSKTRFATSCGPIWPETASR